MKIITCNLGFTNNLDSLKHIAEKLLAYNPDIIVFQEARSMSKTNSIEELHKILSYSHSEFTPAFDHSIDYGKGKAQNESVIEGLGIISKIHFSSKKSTLPITKGLDRWPRIEVLYSFDSFSLLNIHLSKHEVSRAKEVDELSNADIICGDFNMFPEEFLQYFSATQNSYAFEKYISFPSKNETLDYFVIHKGMLTDVKVISEISDHNAIFVEIEELNKLL